MTEKITSGITETGNPLVTFMLLSYNQEKFIREAITGVFSQTYSPLQIIISDDYSSDATYEIIEEMASQYFGPHEIILNRNNKNMGIGSHINKIMVLATGEWIVGAAGDDISTPNRTEEIVKAAQRKDVKPLSIWSRAQHMTSDGNLLDKHEYSDGKPHSIKEIVNNKKVVMGCSHAWHRDVFRIFGPLHQSVIFEDNAISFRSFIAGDIAYIDKTLVYYRQHTTNITNYSKNLNKEDLIKKMSKRRRYALVGIYQRLLDLTTFNQMNPGFERKCAHLSSLLISQLVKQNLKLRLATHFPSIDIVNLAIRNIFKIKK